MHLAIICIGVRAGRTSLSALESGKTVQSIVSACSAHLAGNSPKTKSAVFDLLKSLVFALNVMTLFYAPMMFLSCLCITFYSFLI
jgi:hypothetical protein